LFFLSHKSCLRWLWIRCIDVLHFLLMSLLIGVLCSYQPKFNRWPWTKCPWHLSSVRWRHWPSDPHRPCTSMWQQHWFFLSGKLSSSRLPVRRKIFAMSKGNRTSVVQTQLPISATTPQQWVGTNRLWLCSVRLERDQLCDQYGADKTLKYIKRFFMPFAIPEQCYTVFLFENMGKDAQKQIRDIEAYAETHDSLLHINCFLAFP